MKITPESRATHTRHRETFGNTLSALLIAFALLATSGASIAGDQHDPRIVPPSGKLQGKTYGEWLAGFNQWVYGVPTADNATLLGNEDKLAIGQPKHVWFLGNLSPVVERHFVVPSGKALYFTIFGVEWDNFLCVEPDTNLSVAELRAIAKSIVDTMTDIEVTIDGVAVPDVRAYRSTSPVFALTLPDDNVVQSVFGCADAQPGTYFPVVADAYALLLKPLPIGEHTTRTTALVIVDPTDRSQDVHVDVRWTITVVPLGHDD
jgi:hypothetical protein